MNEHDEDLLQEKGFSIASIFITAVRIRLWKIGDWVRTLFLYYIRSPRFFIADTLILLSYFWISPYRLIRRHDEEGKEQSYGPYGETPFKTLDTILDRFAIPTDFAFIDAGSGRGRTLLWLSLIRKQRKVIGVEPFQPFNEKLQRVLGITGITSIEVSNRDVFSFIQELLDKGVLDFSQTVLYLYMSALPDEECVRLGALLSQCPGLHIVSVSFWLGEYGAAAHMRLLCRREFSFPWGSGEVFYQQVK